MWSEDMDRKLMKPAPERAPLSNRNVIPKACPSFLSDSFPLPISSTFSLFSPPLVSSSTSPSLLSATRPISPTPRAAHLRAVRKAAKNHHQRKLCLLLGGVYTLSMIFFLFLKMINFIKNLNFIRKIFLNIKKILNIRV